MTLKLRVASAWMGAGFVWLAVSLVAQGPEMFKARLSALPADAKTRPDLAGSGSVSATLAGPKLSINGTFEGLRTPATTVQLRSGIATGVRGPVIHDLTVSKSTSGTITGSFDLTADQVENLKKGRFYVQLHSERTPEGTLWGWFLR